MPPHLASPPWPALFAERYGDLLWASLLTSGGTFESRDAAAQLRSLRCVCKGLYQEANRVATAIAVKGTDVREVLWSGLLAKLPSITSIRFTSRPKPAR